ncbi:MAG: 3-isopropylmalate dehydratase small subunit [Fusobacteriaceae bacterium]|jgi:3-isopropylmalate/(R)-2-methylmalate dehydratase small subunit|nr:3-isopropylmalate dehydratase small subunit [Fusobacteriaceae bacterium]
MENIIKGKIVVLSNNIDTDQIYPGRFLALVDPKEIGKHCLEGIDEKTRVLVPGRIIIAGTNFGCGSSREHAVITLMNADVKAIIAESFARIFFRNAINLGLPLVTCKNILKKSENIGSDEEIVINIKEGTITIGQGEVLQSEKLGEHILNIIEAGGIKPMFLNKYSKEEK